MYFRCKIGNILKILQKSIRNRHNSRTTSNENHCVWFWNIFLYLNPYKIKTHQKLSEKVMEKRVEFSKNVPQMFENNELTPNKIIFCDKAHFQLDGFVSKQNWRIWGNENSYVCESKTAPVTCYSACSSHLHGICIEFMDENITARVYWNIKKKKKKSIHWKGE